MRLHTETTGAGPDLVLLHGWGMNGAVWETVAESLSADYRVTIIELPGHGHSPFAGGLDSLRDWARACLSAAPDRAVWIGWSLGGQIAVQAALLSPRRVSGLVPVAASPCFVQADGWPHAVARGTLAGFAATLRDDPRTTLERFLALQVRGSAEARPTLRRLRQGLSDRPDPDPAALDRGLELLRETDLRDRLAGLQCPSLWLLGQRDTLVPAGVAEDIERLLPAARVRVIPGAGHAPFLSHGRESLAALAAFLEQRRD